MPRMTRAALKAQAQTDEYPEPDQHLHTSKEQEPQGTLIHEDLPRAEIGEKFETDIHNEDNLAVRQALRDITDENYPKADFNIEVQSLSPVKRREQQEQEEQDAQKSTRKPRGRAKGRTKKKANTPTIVEPEEEEEAEEPELEVAQTLVEGQESTESTQQTPRQSQEEAQEVEETETKENSVAIDEELSEPGPAVEEDTEQFTTQNSISKTPKFDPSVHVLDAEQARITEDSFVHSITSRSPSKLGSSSTEPPGAAQPSTDSLHALTPLRRTSSTNFEESFEAMDSLEDTIEQMTAGFSLVPGQEVHSPDSPVKTDRRSVRIDATPSASKTAATKTPRSTGNKLQSILRSQDKENTPPVTKTPLKSKTSLKPKTPTTKEATPLKTRTPAVRQSSPVKDGTLSVKKCRTPATKTASDTTSRKPVPTTSTTTTNPVSPTKAARPSSMMVSATNKAQAAAKKPGSTLQRKQSQRQTSVAPATSKMEPLSRKSTAPTVADGKKAHQTSMSFSASPEKPKPDTHQRRVTSGGVLSTSKPGFIPTKSSKPPTTSTFSLPGEAIAEKLKAQKEARAEKMKQPKLTIAEQKAAKLKADREAREERVRLNQLKAEEATKEKENRKPQRPVSMSVLTISKARAEAAERGRQASKEWAEKMLKKKATEVKGEPGPVETTS